MPYEGIATSESQALVIYLIDISGSMAEQLDGAPKIDHVNQSLERVLNKMVQRSTKGEIIAPRYRLTMIAYSDQPYDILGGVQTIDQVAQKGKPTLNTATSTDTAAAFVMARDILRSQLPQLRGGPLPDPAPMVCHLTDGKYTGADPEPIAHEIMQMACPDGNVLVENVYVGPDLTRSPILDIENWQGVSDISELKNPNAQKLFKMSSPLPNSYAIMLNEDGYRLRGGTRMLIPGTNQDLIELAFAISGATPTK